jgi:hypothetical protein
MAAQVFGAALMNLAQRIADPRRHRHQYAVVGIVPYRRCTPDFAMSIRRPPMERAAMPTARHNLF